MTANEADEAWTPWTEGDAQVVELFSRTPQAVANSMVASKTAAWRTGRENKNNGERFIVELSDAAASRVPEPGTQRNLKHILGQRAHHPHSSVTQLRDVPMCAGATLCRTC